MEMTMIAKLVTTACAIALCAGAATAGARQKASDVKDGSKVVCRTVEETGSRLSKTRICRTQTQWAELRRQTREDLERAQGVRPSASN
jgi:hypothetical protein